MPELICRPLVGEGNNMLKLLKVLWKYRSRVSVVTIKDYLQCQRDMKAKGVSKIPLLHLSEEELRDPYAVFADEISFTEAFDLNEKEVR